MGLLSSLSDYLNRRRIQKANLARRGVVRYKPSQIGGFIGTDEYKNNILISGGTEEIRSEALTQLCVVAYNAGIPVILLHQGDFALQRELGKVFGNSFYDISRNGKRFDPFWGMSVQGISKLIVDTAPDSYRFSNDAEAYIEVIADYLSETGKSVTLKGLSSCPHQRLSQLINNASASGKLTAQAAQRIQINLAQGQKEARGVKKYFDELFCECAQLLPINKPDYKNCISLKTAIQSRSIVCIDVISDANDLLIRLILEQLQSFLRQGAGFALVVDNLTMSENNCLKRFCTAMSSRYKTIISGNDLFALCEGEDKLFGTLLGKSGKWFIFHHGSGISAEKWSAAFAKYLKIETTYNSGRSVGRRHPFWLDWSYMTNNFHGESYSNKDESIIRAEEITGLSNRGGIVFTDDPNEIAIVDCFLPA